MKLLPNARNRKPNGAVIYHGPSILDGEDIVVIVTGLRTNSANSKTGAMLQTWIMRADMEPAAALDNGADSSVCGDCIHRSKSCYVIVERAPLQVYRAWKRGSYHDWTKAFPHRALRGKRVRVGSYGDPAAVPFNTWRRVFSQRLAGWTGYTHQWMDPAFRRFRNYLMASVDTVEETLEAWNQGWRTFRVRHDGDDVIKGEEVTCPASEEAGKRTNCANCILCSGNRTLAKSVVIKAHGYRAGKFEPKKG